MSFDLFWLVFPSLGCAFCFVPCVEDRSVWLLYQGVRIGRMVIVISCTWPIAIGDRGEETFGDF